SWLPDAAWSAGKCGRKLLQYVAPGLPGGANPVGLQGERVRHGAPGAVAARPGEWEGASRRRASEADGRRRMGLAGRRLVEAEYEVSRGASAWSEVLRTLEAEMAETIR